MEIKEQVRACLEALKKDPNDRAPFDQCSTLLIDGQHWKKLIKLNEGISELAGENLQLRKRLKDLKSRVSDELEGDKS